MKKAPKIIIGMVVVLVVLIVGLFVLAKVLITPERVRATVVPMAEKVLQRKVSLGEIKVSLFSGIELHDLVVSEKQGEDPFVASDLVRLRYQLLPLLALQVVIDEVRIEAPRIRVERFTDGRFNFSDLLGEEPDAPAEEPNSGGGVAATPLNLLVTEVRIEKGQLLFLDHLIDGRAPYRHEVSDFQLVATGITLDGTVPVILSGRIDQSVLNVKGTVRLTPLSVEADVTLSSLDVVPFKHYFEEALPGILNSLLLGLEAHVTAGPGTITSVGRLSASALDLVLNALPDAPLEKAQIGVDYNLVADMERNLLTIERLRVDFNGVVLEAAGQIDGLATTPRADLRLDVPDLKLRQAMQALPAGLLGPAVTNLDPAGSLRASAVLVGTLDHPQELVREATLTLDKVQASVDSQRPSLDGRLLLTGDRLRSEDLTLSLGENRAALQLAASNLFDKPVVVRADLTSQRFQLDPLLQGGAAAAGAGSETALPDSAVSEIGPLDLPVRAEGEVHITETLWKGMTVRDFVALYTLRDNVLTISRMDGQLAEGSFHNTARVDLNRKGLAYRADLDLKAIQANPLVSALAPKAAGSLFGQLDMTLAVEGSGTKWQAASKKLTGNGDMTLRNGKLVSPGLVKGLSGALQVTDLEELVFDTFTGNLRIRDGKVLLDSKMNSSLIRLAAKGNIGLDGSLDLGLDTRLGPELSARIDSSGSLARYLRDEQGWTRLPLKLGGSFGTPRFGLDAKGVQQEATKALQQELGKQLQEKLLGTPKTDADPNAPQTQEDPASKLLKGLLGK